MTLQPIVPARPRPALCAELTDAPRPTRPVAARRGQLRARPRRDHRRTTRSDLAVLTHASPTVRAELGQFLADHGQHPVAGLRAFLDCLQLSAGRHHPRDAHGERTPSRSTSGDNTRSHNTRPHSTGGADTSSHLGQESFSYQGQTCRSVTTESRRREARRVWHLILAYLQ